MSWTYLPMRKRIRTRIDLETGRVQKQDRRVQPPRWVYTPPRDDEMNEALRGARNGNVR